MKNSSVKWVWLSIIVVIIDQLVKYWASNYLDYREPVAVLPGLNMTLVHNTGAAFSFLREAGGWQRWFFICLSSGVSIALFVWLYRLPPQHRWLGCALALVMGGAVGNLWDRITLGYVIDFIDVYYQHWHWPAFNFADSAISVGAVMLIIDALWFDRVTISTHVQKPGGR
jgi:signal peptidase II